MSDDFKIESGIPIPPSASAARRKYPLATMQIGECFTIECEPSEIQKVRGRLGASITYQRPKRFVTRRVDVGVRVWRIE